MTLETLPPLPLQHYITKRIPLSGAVDFLRPLWGWKEQFTLGALHPCSLFCHSEGAHLQKDLQTSMKIQSFQQGKAGFYNHAGRLDLRWESLLF